MPNRYVNESRVNRKATMDDFPSTYTEGLFASASSMFNKGLAHFSKDSAELDNLRVLKTVPSFGFGDVPFGTPMYPSLQDIISPDEANALFVEKVGMTSMEAISLKGIDSFKSYDSPVLVERVELEAERWREEASRQRAIARMPDTWQATGVTFLGAIAGDMADPGNLALYALPMVSRARVITWSAKSNVFVARTAAGVVEGSAAGFLGEFAYSQSTKNIGVNDYGPKDFFMNVAIGSFIGGVLRNAGGLADLVHTRVGNPQKTLKSQTIAFKKDGLTPEVRKHMGFEEGADRFNMYVRNMLLDKRPNVHTEAELLHIRELYTSKDIGIFESKRRVREVLNRGDEEDFMNEYWVPAGHKFSKFEGDIPLKDSDVAFKLADDQANELSLAVHKLKQEEVKKQVNKKKSKKKGESTSDAEVKQPREEHVEGVVDLTDPAIRDVIDLDPKLRASIEKSNLSAQHVNILKRYMENLEICRTLSNELGD